MNMKKFAPVAMTALLFGSAVVPVASANEKPTEAPQIQIDPIHIFNNTYGTVEKVHNGEKKLHITR